MSDQDPSWPSEPPSAPPPGDPPTPPPGTPPVSQSPGGEGVDPRSGLAYATYGQRAQAYLIDFGVVLVGVVAIVIVGFIFGLVADFLQLLVTFVGYLAVIGIGIGNLIMGEGGPLSQTLGKHLIGIKVVGDSPGPLGYGKAAIRWVGRILDSIVCGLPIGILWPLFDDENRTWHDIVADTRVVVAPTGEKSAKYWLDNFRG